MQSEWPAIRKHPLSDIPVVTGVTRIQPHSHHDLDTVRQFVLEPHFIGDVQLDLWVHHVYIESGCMRVPHMAHYDMGDEEVCAD